jgi:hypothetical protein
MTDTGFGTCLVQSLPGLGQLGLLEAILDQDCDLQSCEVFYCLPLSATFFRLP